MDKKTIFLLGLIAIGISIVPFGFYRFFFGNTILTDNEKWGQFGDFIGGVLNPFIALFSFIALLITLWYQSKEIRKNDRIRKHDEIVNALQLLEKSIEPKMEMILSRQYTLPSKNQYNYRMAASLSNDFMIFQSYLKEISRYSKSKSLIGLYKYKYLDIIKVLLEKEYIDNDLFNYYTTAEE